MDDGTVVGRALEVIEAVSQMGPHASLVEIAALTGIPKPTVLRILRDLSRREVLVRDESGYMLGPRLVTLGRDAELHRDYAGLTPALEALQARCGGIAWLVAGSGISSFQPVSLVVEAEFKEVARTGWPTPSMARSVLVNTALGRVLLSQRPDLVEKLLRGGLPPTTPFAPQRAEQLQVILARVRDEGGAVETEQSQLGWRCSATGFVGPDGQRAFVGVIVPVTRSDPRRLLRATLDAGASLTQAIPQEPASPPR